MSPGGRNLGLWVVLGGGKQVCSLGGLPSDITRRAWQPRGCSPPQVWGQRLSVPSLHGAPARVQPDETLEGQGQPGPLGSTHTATGAGDSGDRGALPTVGRSACPGRDPGLHQPGESLPRRLAAFDQGKIS